MGKTKTGLRLSLVHTLNEGIVDSDNKILYRLSKAENTHLNTFQKRMHTPCWPFKKKLSKIQSSTTHHFAHIDLTLIYLEVQYYRGNISKLK